MEIEKKRKFIINILYFAIILAIVWVILEWGLSLIMPFIIAFLISWALQRPIRFLSEKLRVHKKILAIFLVLLFYCTIGLLIALLIIKSFSAVGELIASLPALYEAHINPLIGKIYDSLESSFIRLDPELMNALDTLIQDSAASIGEIISGLSMTVAGAVSGAASSLPGFLIRLLLMVISTFFISMDYDRLMGFILRQFNDRTQELFFQIKKYIIGTLFVCIRSYALIMSITFVELSIGLHILRVENAFLIALLIAVFDILPVLGTGGIMIPWAIITFLLGNYSLAIGLAVLYVVITIIRNILEPKIVGGNIGLHPVVTLISLFVGAQLFGVVGLFGFPIFLSLLVNLNKNGTIHLFKMDESKESTESPKANRRIMKRRRK
ncbi:sporulation integral membrane protein YtvI [Zhenpiania hominis]|uniref:Sporulation integral membrane protein YtvI n=1 Tax=Zhenpiania hominis TaxID=2763644 RepID=A0A923SWM8_9FIRM|nr:sporulation integral membrane protein YtvI [Zhenpiania hominis]MBC6680488.1 sporulation integral membrane protein YtvI [Zhenpiania hominis]